MFLLICDFLTHTHTRVHTLSLSLSLSHTHTHIYTLTLSLSLSNTHSLFHTHAPVGRNVNASDLMSCCRVDASRSLARLIPFGGQRRDQRRAERNAQRAKPRAKLRRRDFPSRADTQTNRPRRSEKYRGGTTLDLPSMSRVAAVWVALRRVSALQ